MTEYSASRASLAADFLSPQTLSVLSSNAGASPEGSVAVEVPFCDFSSLVFTVSLFVLGTLTLSNAGMLLS